MKLAPDFHKFFLLGSRRKEILSKSPSNDPQIAQSFPQTRKHGPLAREPSTLISRITMPPRTALPLFLLSAVCLTAFSVQSSAQTSAAPSGNRSADLQFVVVLSRHGVRSPLNSQADLDRFSAAPWPRWDVAPGIQTTHGNELIKILAAWDRAQWIKEGLLAASGCADADRVTIIADTDQRTRETGRMLAEGMLPGCRVAVQSRPDGAADPLFRALNAGNFHPDTALAAASIEGRIGGDPKNLTEAYRPQLAALDHVLAGCGKVPANPRRTSIFDIPASLKPGSGSNLAASRGPLVTASTLVENLLLEYTQGMSDADTGWGCLNGATLRYLMQIDTAAWDYGYRTPALARIYASNLLDKIEKTLEQGATGKPVSGALGKPGDKLVILIGHDSNIAPVAGALGIDWIIDGRVDDTPPGGALIFELWRSRTDGKPFVRVEYRAQTLEQMRQTQPLSPANPPAIAPVFVPGCGQPDLSCTWEGFSSAMRRAIDPAYVVPQSSR
jgi:4-phytase / acid phosphatase